MGMKPFIIECFKNILFILFIKHLMINVTKTLCPHSIFTFRDCVQGDF